ncbi:MAG: Omp28-related outer membrane protein, partial [Muribaculaceae bacterium]|nr:Omp28-related outer membrane protein [Muribaculaceae bacterium]
KNCPLGYLAFDYIRERFGNAMIPIGLHTYQSDPLGSGMSAYSQYLGLDQAGAPSARINRNPLISYPMISTADGYALSGSGIYGDNGVEEQLWYDLVRDELSQPAELGIDFGSEYDAAAAAVNVECMVRSALNSSDNSINIFAVLLENRLEAGYQSNGYASISDPILGEWGSGGKYGMSYVYPFTVDDVARSVWGTTYNGTGGLVPATLNSFDEYHSNIKLTVPQSVKDINNCDVVVMLIDAASGKVINCDIAPVGESTADFVSSVGNIAADSGCNVSVSDGHILASGDGQMQLRVFSVYGSAIGSAKGEGHIDLDLGGYRGFAVVALTTADGRTHTTKVMVK